jgi:Tfp pilus assembly protein PilF
MRSGATGLLDNMGRLRISLQIRWLSLAGLIFTLAAAGTSTVVGWPLATYASHQSSKRGGRDGRAARAIAEGAAALERGDERAAKISFQRALDADPDNVKAHTYLGIIAVRANDIKEAEHHFAAAASAAPFESSARNNYGAILLRLGRTAQAREQFEASLKLNRDQPSALINLGQIRFATGQPEDLHAARDLFERAQTIAPDTNVARALVVTSLKLGDRIRAASSYRDYAARLSNAAEVETPAASTRAELGTALLEAGLVDEAVLELSAAVASDPANVSVVVALSRAQLQRKDIPAAGRTLEGAIARGLNAGAVYAALADVYAAGGYIENAIPAMRLAIARDPQNEVYHFRYGLLLTDSRAPAAAIIRLQEALKEFPTSARLWLALGIAQLTYGKNVEAEQAFRRSLQLDPKSVPALAYLGTTNAERGEYARAIEFYERAIAANDKLAAPYYLAADALLKLPDADTARAEKYLTQAIELDPLLAPARLALAKLYERSEHWADAATQLERSVQLAPDLTEAHYRLGRVYMRLKRTSEAERELAVFKHQSESAKKQREDERREIVRRLANVRF